MPLNESDHQQEVQNKIKEAVEKRSKAREEMDKKQKIIRDIQQEDYMMKKENEQNEER